MIWECRMSTSLGCHRDTGICEWKRFKDIGPPTGCMVSISVLKEKAVKCIVDER